MANSTVIIPFSGSTQGKGIKIVATATAGTAIHSTTTSATTVDRVYLWAVNSQAAATASTVLLTLEFGGVTSPDNLIQMPIPGQAGQVQVCDGNLLLGSGAAVASIAGFAATANVIMVYGYILRVTP